MFFYLQINIPKEFRPVKVRLRGLDWVPAYKMRGIGIVGAFVEVAFYLLGQMHGVDSHDTKGDAYDQFPGEYALLFFKGFGVD